MKTNSKWKDLDKWVTKQTKMDTDKNETSSITDTIIECSFNSTLFHIMVVGHIIGL